MLFPKPLAAAMTLGGIAIVGVVDYYSGVELRVFPLYYLPISFAAWHLGRSWALAAATLSAASWLGSNYLAGLGFSGLGIWLFNLLMQGTSFATVGVLIAMLKRSAAHEQELSRKDPLTSLLNSRAFEEEAERVRALSRRGRHPVTIAYIDLDGFKGVNDTLGHQGGDRVLRSVATIVLKCTRSSDLTARLGGDEFAVLLPETGPIGAREMLERLRVHLAETLSQTECPVTASIGGVAFLTVPDTVDAMVREADGRMYAAKAAGKNRVQLDVVGEP
jgi:diguanylate cyclase (GGDEF)-like protein